MYKLNKLVMLSCLAAPIFLSGCGALFLTGASSAASTQVSQDSRSLSTMVYDETIEQRAYEILKSNGTLSKPEQFRITVTAFNGIVLLTGQTINKDYLKWAVRQIEKIEHVNRVYNYATLQVPVPASVVSSDSYITSKVKTQLLFGKDISSNRFKVVTENGNVFLMGLVTEDEGRRAINTILKIDGVRKVYKVYEVIADTRNVGNGAQQNENLRVAPVKGNQADYRAPYNARSNSAYVPPASTRQNGGAYIIDSVNDSPVAPVRVQAAPAPAAPVYTAPAPNPPRSSAPSSQGGGSNLLAPSSQY